jgi:hypothetical protein
MPSPVHGFIREIEAARLPLRAGAKSGKQLQAQSARDALRTLAEKYFNAIRPSILAPNAQDAEVSSVDASMQQLIELCHRRASMNAYSTLLSTARSALISIDSRHISGGTSRTSEPSLIEVDQLIVTTLDSVVPSAASSFRQGLADLRSVDRLSWRGPATDFRECLRETLDRLAPDEAVTKEPGYKPDPDARGPTMKQKVRYILRARGQSKSQMGATESAVDAVEEAIGVFVRSVYTRSSVSTHVATSRDEVLRIRDLVRVVLSELLEIRR